MQNVRKNWFIIGLTVIGLLLVGSWLIPGWKQVDLTVSGGAGSERLKDQPFAEVTTSASDLPTEGGCGHAPCPADLRNYFLYDYIDIHVPIMPGTPVVNGVAAEADRIHVTISYTGAPGRGLWTGIERSSHWVLTVRTRKGLISGRTVQIHTAQPGSLQ